MLKKIKNMFKAPAKVVVLQLRGIISDGPKSLSRSNNSLNFASLRLDIIKAFADKNTKAVALLINSPGGAPGQTELLYRYIYRLSQEKSIPVYSFVEDVAASGGYWLACAGKEIYALETSILGSIGVVSAGFGFVKLLEKLGIERRVITQGKSKMIWDPFTPEKDSDKKLISELQKDTYESFQALIKDSRGKKLNIKDEKLFSGEFWTGKRAMDYGLIDGIGDFHTIITEKFGKDILIECADKKPSFIHKMLGISNTPNDIVEQLIEKLDEKIAFSRFRLW